MDNESTYNIADEIIIHDLETLKVLADPLRLQILQAIGAGKPRAVKQIAKALQHPPNKLYYHVKMLEEHGLIQVVETRVVSGIIEKLYLTTAQKYAPSLELFSVNPETGTGGLSLMLDSVWGSTKQDLMTSVRASIADLSTMNDEDTTTGIISSNLLLPPAKAVEFHQRLQALFQEFGLENGKQTVEGEEAQHYRFLYIFFPLVGDGDPE